MATPLVTTATAAQIAGVAHSTIRKWIQIGKLTAIPMGAVNLVNPKDLRKLSKGTPGRVKKISK